MITATVMMMTFVVTFQSDLQEYVSCMHFGACN